MPVPVARSGVADTEYTLNDILIVAYPFLRLPLDKLRINLKNQQRLCERDFMYCSGVVEDMLKRDASTFKNDPESCSMSSQRATLAATSAVARLDALQEKLKALSNSSEEYLATLKERAEYLDELVKGTCDFGKWCEKRLDHFLVDYALRKGWFESAMTLAEAKDVSVSCHR